MNILVTGFDPFGGEDRNPSYEAVKALPNKLGNLSIIKCELKTEFVASKKQIDELLTLHKPSVILLVGQAGGRKEIALERIAINLMDARIKDNAGYQPIDKEVIIDGPKAFFTTLPIKRMSKTLTSANIANTISYSAGTYVCNSIYYYTLFKSQAVACKVIFIHLPFASEQKKAGYFSMPLATMTEALKLCILETTCKSDIEESFGTIY